MDLHGPRPRGGCGQKVAGTVHDAGTAVRIGPHRLDRVELAGSLGDLGTLLPLAIALITVNGLSFTAVFLLVGLFYVASGLYYRLPVPVQPLKVVAAVALATPETITPPVIAATGLLIGIILLLLGVTGMIERLARLFAPPIIRGIQFGLGFILVVKGLELMIDPALFLGGRGEPHLGPFPLNAWIGVGGAVVALFLLSSRRFPAALVLIGLGVVLAVPFHTAAGAAWAFGPSPLPLALPGADELATAAVLLVVPQLPLTVGNAALGTEDVARTLFGRDAPIERANARRFTISMGFANVAAGALTAMPMCHGAGGLAAHYRFGARTGGSNLIIGVLLVGVALVFGRTGIYLLSSIPNAVLGLLLLFAGLELALLVRDVTEKRDLFVVLLIGGVGLATTNMSAALVAGIVLYYLLRWGKMDV